MGRLAVFDFDNTLIRGDAGVLFGHWLLGHGWLAAMTPNPVRAAGRVARMGLLTSALLAKEAAGRTAHATGMLTRRELVRRAYQAFGGLESRWTRERLHDFGRRHLPQRTKAHVVDRLRSHAADGDTIVILSSGLRDLIWPWREAQRARAEVVACELQEEDGRLTGTVSGPLNGEDKLLRAFAIARRRGFRLEEATVYSDHHDDLALLLKAGHPVAVDPTWRLRRVAERRRWEILA